MEKEYYKTSDIDLASTMLASGFPIDGIYARPESNKMDFYFEKTQVLIDTINAYWGRKLLVEPLELLGARKEILIRLKEGSLYA
jgi:hypothetical protein